MWELLDVEIIPLILSAIELILKNLPYHLSQLFIEKGNLVAKQKAVIVGTVETVRRFFNR